MLQAILQQFGRESVHGDMLGEEQNMSWYEGRLDWSRQDRCADWLL